MNPQEGAASEPRLGPLGARHTATVTLDGSGCVVMWSPGAFRVLGYSSEEMVGRELAGLVRDDVPEAVGRFLTGVGGRAVTTTFRVRDGRDLSVELLAPEVPDPGGGGARLVVITPVREEQHDLLEWSFEQFPFMAGITDHDLRFVRLNERATAAFGSPEGGRLGATPTEQVGYPEGERTETAMRHAMETGEATTLNTFVKLPNAERAEAWQGLYVPLKDPRGIVRGLYSVALDIGAQHLARQRLALLNQASRIGSTLDVTRTAEELAEVVTPGVADYVTVDLLEWVLTDEEPEYRPPPHPVSMRRIAHLSVLEGTPEAALPVGGVEVYPGDGPHVQALVTGRPQVIPAGAGAQTTDWGAFGEFLARDYGLHSALILPIVASGTLLGVAAYMRHQTPDPFDSDDLLLAQEITARAAVSIDNALRYARQRATALALQRSLLPQHPPQQAAVETAWRYRPAGRRAGVGGDWFDVIPLSGARVALVVGDVVGHGVRAAAAMGRLRTAVRTLSDVEMSPDELLTHLDDIVASQLAGESRDGPESDAEIGASCVYAIYDPVSRRCTIARAGHPPPALVDPDGTVTFLDDVPAGPPLGLGGLLFENYETQLPEKSLLVIYTNGLFRSNVDDLDAGRESLRRVLAEAPDSLEETCEAVLRTMLPGPVDDDVALLLARTHALRADRIATWDLPSDPAAVGEARGFAARQLSEWDLSEAAFTTELVVSELITNAIRHASGPIRLRLIFQDTLICEVSDSSDTYPHLRQARVYDEGGRGLMLVAQLSDRWGTRPTTNGKIIWASQSLPPRSGRSNADDARRGA